MYLAIKHLHIALVVFSGLGLLVRGLLALSDSPLLQSRWARTVPHINDTLLLGAAIILTMMIGQYPFVDAWLTAKIFGLICYIVLGAIALGPGRPRVMRTMALCAALAVFGYIVSVAVTKNPWGFLTVLTGG